MRMIDADRLYDQVEARYRQSSGEAHRTERSLLDAICNSPTIDAIPVEWLISWSNKRYRETQKDVSIVDVLAAWQKEQEAQDG